MEIQYAKSETFNDLKKDGTVLVDFYADWCGPCQMVGPELEILASELEEGQSIVKVNVDDVSDIAAEYSVLSIPTLLVFKDGEKVDQKVGVSTAPEMKEWLAKFK